MVEMMMMLRKRMRRKAVIVTPPQVDGTHYHFSTREVMMAMKDANEFIETAQVHSNMYAAVLLQCIYVTICAGTALRSKLCKALLLKGKFAFWT